MPSSCNVRRPKVWAAAATAVLEAPTRTKNSAMMSTRIRFRVMSAPFIAARHLDAQDIHVDRGDFVQHRDDKGAAVYDNLFAKEPGADERRLLGGAAIKPAHNVYEDDDRDREADQPKQHFPKRVRTHFTLRSFSRALAAARIELSHSGLFSLLRHSGPFADRW